MCKPSTNRTALNTGLKQEGMKVDREGMTALRELLRAAESISKVCSCIGAGFAISSVRLVTDRKRLSDKRFAQAKDGGHRQPHWSGCPRQVQC